MATRGTKESGLLGGLPATVLAEHRLNLATSRETDRENGFENRSPVFSYERSPRVDVTIIDHTTDGRCKVGWASK